MLLNPRRQRTVAFIELLGRPSCGCTVSESENFIHQKNSFRNFWKLLETFGNFWKLKFLVGSFHQISSCKPSNIVQTRTWQCRHFTRIKERLLKERLDLIINNYTEARNCLQIGNGFPVENHSIPFKRAASIRLNSVSILSQFDSIRPS